MRSILFGIAIIHFGIALIIVSSGSSETIGFIVSVFGLLMSFYGWKFDE